ncbi:ATP binding microtubule motor protein [Raphidocelis subcapitata]|uniref:ATP binding microtubule motor protein n=1 Tax=Raphidocelis subcapitata TaxID=307507 RepID=A0A2V0NSH8_9CHLO|nr:ATP binding microtubule motor protein [Raphidocelis subcapitata]|eukprot:GBF90584.1 ATP binding microtubule motor protein [Raphidocelis subcapitata]
MEDEPQSPRSKGSPASPRDRGELVDRLLGKIASLEARLQQAGGGGGGGAGGAAAAAARSGDDPPLLIKALRAPAADAAHQTPPRAARADGELLSTLGDPDQRPLVSTEWLGSVGSWVRQRAASATSKPPPGPPAAATAAGADADAGAGGAAGAHAAGARTRWSLPARPGALAGAGGTATASSTWRALRQYSRYVSAEPAASDGGGGDDDARVQAMGEALAEANERLVAADGARRRAEAGVADLQRRLGEAAAAAADVERLKDENLEAWRAKYDLEARLAAAAAQAEGHARERAGLQSDLDALRRQAAIWQDAGVESREKWDREGRLLREQLEARGRELGALRAEVTRLEAERDAALQELRRAQEERSKALEERDRAAASAAAYADLRAALAEARAAAAAATAAAAEAQENFLKERTVRRKLHEQLQVLRGNIRVLARVRPPQPGARTAVAFPLEGLLTVSDPASGRAREFEFDAVFGPGADQAAVFEEARPLVRSCADGFNACIFAYGQTGSGKTHTMTGPPDAPGINTRALQELFRIAAEEPDRRWSFSVAVLEIYNEAVHDLLALAAAGYGGGGGGGDESERGGGGGGGSARTPRAPSGDVLARCTLDVSGLGAGEMPAGMDRVQGLVWRPVSTPEQAAAALREGGRARRTASTALNAASSRSHALLSVKVRALQDGAPVTTLMHLVDLAGSERIDKSEVTGEQLKEAQAINKSLSALGDVISALQRRTPHVPFRNSKLTQVLQDSLCGSSKVLLVCNLSPEAVSAGETLSSLNFASRAAQVELGPARRAAGGGASTPPPGAPAAPGGGGGGGGEGGGGGGDAGRPGSAGSGGAARGARVSGGATSRLGERAGGAASPAGGGSPRLAGASAAAAAAAVKPARH